MSTAAAEPTTTTEPAADAPVPSELTACPACGCGGAVLFTVSLDYPGSFRVDYNGIQPEEGDTITRCDQCANFFVHTETFPAALLDPPAPPTATAPWTAGDPTRRIGLTRRVFDSPLPDGVSSDRRVAPVDRRSWRPGDTDRRVGPADQRVTVGVSPTGTDRRVGPLDGDRRTPPST